MTPEHINELIYPDSFGPRKTKEEPGKELFIDWIGDTLDIVVDCDTGEIRKNNQEAATTRMRT